MRKTRTALLPPPAAGTSIKASAVSDTEAGNGSNLDYRMYGKGFIRGAGFHSDEQGFDHLANGADWGSEPIGMFEATTI